MDAFTYDVYSNLGGSKADSVGGRAMLASANNFDQKQKFETEVSL